MAQLKFRTMYSKAHVGEFGYKSLAPSLAIPGQAFPLAEKIARLRAGLPINVLKYGYNPDGFPRIGDLTELDSFKEFVKNKKNDIEQKIEALKDNRDATTKEVASE